jgi:hypothetical protein
MISFPLQDNCIFRYIYVEGFLLDYIYLVYRTFMELNILSQWIRLDENKRAKIAESTGLRKLYLSL